MMIDEALFRYSADKTGLADFGLESAGKNILRQHAIWGHYPLISEMPFKWRFAGRLIVAHF